MIEHKRFAFCCNCKKKMRYRDLEVAASLRTTVDKKPTATGWLMEDVFRLSTVVVDVV